MFSELQHEALFILKGVSLKASAALHYKTGQVSAHLWLRLLAGLQALAPQVLQAEMVRHIYQHLQLLRRPILCYVVPVQTKAIPSCKYSKACLPCQDAQGSLGHSHFVLKPRQHMSGSEHEP